MIDFIILLIIIGIIALGFNHTVRYLKGQDCACSSSKKQIEKTLENVLYQKVFKVNGIHCDGCKNNIERIINSHPNLKGKVNMRKKVVVISYNADVEDEKILKAIEKGGYHAERI